ncbi:hypothetical protein V491_02067 [Pseudogymnoascus sp. VKM F-3775]|nr:hypothetical protein V491_02067 [Pseudogymnoascus sp. VKM F-3775]
MTAVTKPTNPDGLVLEAWAQGYMVGSIVIMICITLSNMRRGVLLHKIILLELMLGTFHGTFIFTHAPIYCCVVAWMKAKPFMGRKTNIAFVVSMAAAQPYWALEIYANFAYFNNINDIYLKIRVFEALFRDPWWVYASCVLLYKIRTRYSFGFFELIYISPRFAIMLFAMIVSIIFTIIDICAVTGALKSTLPIGINPFWKLAFVFKLLTDSVILDDFKTALDKLSHYNLSRIEDQLGRSWVTSKNNITTIHREIMGKPLVPPNGRAVSTGESDIFVTRPGIAVLTETKVESYYMSDMGKPASSKASK